jgi:hypothetical protein
VREVETDSSSDLPPMANPDEQAGTPAMKSGKELEYPVEGFKEGQPRMGVSGRLGFAKL